MKNTFHTLYYTGLGILGSILVVGSLLAINIENIFNVISNNNTEPKPFTQDTSGYVIKTEPNEPPVNLKPKVVQTLPKVQNELKTEVIEQSKVIVKQDTSKTPEVDKSPVDTAK